MPPNHGDQWRDDPESSQPLMWTGSRLELAEDEGYESLKAQRNSLVLQYTKKAIVLFAFSALGAVVYHLILSTSGRSTSGVNSLPANSAKEDFLNASNYLVTGNASSTALDNLVASEKYITTILSSGWTNQVMEATNLLYLAILTKRIPVIPPFMPTHFGKLGEVGALDFGDVFDVPLLSSKLGIPVIQWHELKLRDAPTGGGPGPIVEKVGCWSTHAGNKISGGAPWDSTSLDALKLDISYTPVPPSLTVTHGSKPEVYIWSLWALATLGYPETRASVLPYQTPATLPVQSGSGEKLEPNDHLMCFDDLYYTGLVEPDPAKDFFKDYSPLWSEVGVHMHWKQTLVDLANQYLRRHFGVQNEDPIPPFISVHVRRTDFELACPQGADRDKCFAPVTKYQQRVQEIKEALQSRADKLVVTAVLVTSDESNPKWWDQIAALGPEWGWIDHTAEKTVEKHSKWYPVILDAVFQSMGAGFVGTMGSTMSDLARKRVQHWHNGPGVDVRWGNF